MYGTHVTSYNVAGNVKAEVKSLYVPWRCVGGVKVWLLVFSIC